MSTQTQIIQSKGKVLSTVNNKKVKDIEWEGKSDGKNVEVTITENGKTQKISSQLPSVEIYNDNFDKLAGLDNGSKSNQHNNIIMKIEEKNIGLGPLIMSEILKLGELEDYINSIPSPNELENIILKPRPYSTHNKTLRYTDYGKITDNGKRIKSKNLFKSFTIKNVKKDRKKGISFKNKLIKNPKNNQFKTNTRKNKL